MREIEKNMKPKELKAYRTGLFRDTEHQGIYHCLHFGTKHNVNQN